MKRANWPQSDMGFSNDTADHKRNNLGSGKRHQAPMLKGPTGFCWLVDAQSFYKSADCLTTEHQKAAFEVCYTKRRHDLFASYGRILGTRFRCKTGVESAKFKELCNITKRTVISGYDIWIPITQEHRCFLIFLGQLHRVVHRVIKENAHVSGDLRTWDPWCVEAALDERGVPSTNEVNIYKDYWPGAVPAMPGRVFINAWRQQNDEQVNTLNSEIAEYKQTGRMH